jgi:glutamate racemase
MTQTTFTADQMMAIFAAMQTTAQPTTQALIQGNNRKVIVRSRDAGVQFGELVEYASDGSTVTLKNARQMWSWTAKQGGTLLDCAVYGVSNGKFSLGHPNVVIIGACAIIDVMEAAVPSLEDTTWA